MNRLTGVVSVATGVSLLAFRPMSRTNPSFRVLDFVLGLWSLLNAWRFLG
jgi:hypothetical protein